MLILFGIWAICVLSHTVDPYQNIHDQIFSWALVIGFILIVIPGLPPFKK
jgi:hypothetical protein